MCWQPPPEISPPQTVDAGPAQGAVLAGAQPTSRFLHLAHGSLQVAAGKDHAARCAFLYHGIDIRQAGLNGLVSGDALDASLSSGDDGLLDVLAGQHDYGNVGDDVSEEVLRVLVECADAKALADGLAALGVVFGDGN